MMIKLKNWLAKFWPWLTLGVLALIFFIGVSSFNYTAQKNGFIKWVSPDESANYNFAKLYAQEGQLSFFEKYNLPAGEIIHPRSYRSDAGWLKPVSFLGIILIYGKIASIFGYKIIPYLTPLLAAIGLFFFFLLVKGIFGRRNALISSLLLASFPVYIYYSARSMFHNVLFTVFIIAGFYFSLLMAKKKSAEPRGEKPAPKKIVINRLFFSALAGLFFGLAVITRTSELIWLGPALLLLWLVNIRKISLTRLLVFLAFFSLALLPAAYHNKILYGSYWRGGYNEMNRSIINITRASQDLINPAKYAETAEAGQTPSTGWKTALAGNWRIIRDNLFYFGWHPEKSLKMLYYYFTKMFYWLFWPTIFGFIIFCQQAKKWKTKHYAYLAAYGLTSAILLFYYGSWTFHDNPDPKSFTIGNSYTRYWLPIYLGAMPLASVFILRLGKILKKKYLALLLPAAAVLLVFYLSLQFVLFGREEGLYLVAKKQEASRLEYNKVLALTESNSVIITKYHDKLFFPERKVIVGLFDDNNMNGYYAKLTEYLPVYYYNFTLPDKDFNYLNNGRLKIYGLKITAVEKINNNFTLYKLSQAELKNNNGQNK